VISFIVGLVPQSVFKQGTGEMAQFLLEAQGIKTNTIGLAECKEYSWITDSINDECYSFSTREEQKTIIISWLCTGITEIIILIGAILASFGVNWRKRVIGAIAAIPAGIIFNLLRIWITINIILSQSIQTVELAHDFLFKIMLFIYVVVFYVIWFYWAERKEK
jgi:exosortase/archaeosortase family protein